ncbi:DUF420 domain-containing protein [bacterium]|nr:DUF420 domain-containing protein [bacterium]
MTFAEILPHFNASMNATSAVCVLIGVYFVRRKNLEAHKRMMLAAVAASTLFLIGYLTRHALTGTTHYAGRPELEIVYLSILYSHMALAAVTAPLVIRVLFLATRERIEEHKRLARWTVPIWLYVSITGIVVYRFLYPLPFFSH